MQILKFTKRLWPNWLESITKHVADPRIQSRCIYSIEEILFSGLMIFLLRYRSLRSFCLEHRNNEISINNFQRWITISNIPCDDELRYGLQTVRTCSINNLLKDFHQQLERKKTLSSEKLFNSHELVVLDGTGHLNSTNIKCDRCLIKNLQNGEVHFYHGQLLATLTNVNASYSLPLQFEPIEKSDTETQYTKNDCELNAVKRLLPRLRSQFPKRNFCFLADNLMAVDSVINIILERGWSFIFTAKPERNKEVFFMSDYLHEKRKELKQVDQNGTRRIYQWSNELPLKQYSKNQIVTHVNLIQYRETDQQGQIIYQSSWITNLQITTNNIKTLVQAARSRFVIENRNFNEQKNLGFHTEHNFGHFGNLPNVFFGLAQIAQLISEMFCLWKKGKADILIIGSKRRYFEKLAVIVAEIILPENTEPIFNLKFEFNSC